MAPAKSQVTGDGQEEDRPAGTVRPTGRGGYNHANQGLPPVVENTRAQPIRKFHWFTVLGSFNKGRIKAAASTTAPPYRKALGVAPVESTIIPANSGEKAPRKDAP